MRKYFSKGFTLVELLIVIAVIGILAVAVMAAIDPIEQLKKSRDTAKLADSRELLGSYQRYYASKNCYPADYLGGCLSTTARDTITSATGTTVNTDMTTMTTAGELKSTFPDKTNVKKGWLLVTLTTNGDLGVCFPPESKNARSGALSGLYNIDQTTVGSHKPVSITTPDPALCVTPYVPNAYDAGCMVCVQ